MQTVLSGRGSIERLASSIAEWGCKKVLVVCDGAYDFLPLKSVVDSWDIARVFFRDFTANPLYEDVCKGLWVFENEGCDGIVAIGGGSAMDVAKCVKLFSGLKKDTLFLSQPFVDSKVPLFAVPTTAGTGSESTRYAVIYYEGKKQSVTHESIIPNGIVLDSDVLSTLPLYQRKCTMLDALCQAIESAWSVHSTAESHEFSQAATRAIVQHYPTYLKGDASAEDALLEAANLAGRAINITQTTAAHAMSYQLTKLYGLPHGHAVAVGLPRLWRYMGENMNECIDPRGEEYLQNVFGKIAAWLGCPDVPSAITWFENLLSELEIKDPKLQQAEELQLLCSSVNPDRLKNNPVALDAAAIEQIYREILRN